MKFFVCSIIVITLCGCVKTKTYRIPEQERPTVNIPYSMRCANYMGGSCGYASLASLLQWQGKHELADYVRRNMSGGVTASEMDAQLSAIGMRYAFVRNGDVAFLEWAVRTRRGCNITVNGGNHMITLVHLDSKWAAVLDNNDISRFIWIPRNKLIAEWKSSYGWAVTCAYTPAAPLP